MATPSTLSLLSLRGSGFSIPPHDYEAFTYVASGAASDDSVATTTYKLGGSSGTTVAILTFVYVGSTNNVASITLTH